MRLAVFIVLLNAILALLPQLNLPPTVFAILNSVLGALVAVARIVRQPDLHTETGAGPEEQRQ